jgi:hypothetical protein
MSWDFNLPFHRMMEQAKQQYTSDFFMEIFMLGAWLIWKERNGTIFSGGGTDTLPGWENQTVQSTDPGGSKKKETRSYQYRFISETKEDCMCSMSGFILFARRASSMKTRL